MPLQDHDHDVIPDHGLWDMDVQLVAAQAGNDGSTGSTSVKGDFAFPVAGGLRGEEFAELVYLSSFASLTIDEVPGAATLQADINWGLNMAPTESLSENSVQTQGLGEQTSGVDTGDEFDGGTVTNTGQIMAHVGNLFIGNASGSAGAAQDTMHEQLNLRDAFGGGYFATAEDDLTLALDGVSSNFPNEWELKVRGVVVWDVHEHEHSLRSRSPPG